MASEKLIALFQDYATHHRTKGNRYTHNLGIPLIMLGLFGLLDRLALGPITAGHVLVASALAWYLTLDLVLGLSFGAVSLGIYALGQSLPMPALWTAFVLGWVLQGIGHYVFEKRSPSFAHNLKHLLIGPLWIFAKLTGLNARLGESTRRPPPTPPT